MRIPVPPEVSERYDVRRLVFLFALAYFAQGLGQHGGLISQPLNFYLKQGLGLDTATAAEYLAILSLPWMIKPLYGLVSDYVPLLGYRRKTWLVLVNLVAACAFLWLSDLTQIGTIIVALTLTAFGTAASDVIIDALMVENGQRTGMIARFQGVQWLWFKLAAIITALLGGHLASLFEPASALHMAATITMVAPLSVLMAAMVLVREERLERNIEEARATTRAMLAAFRSPELRLAIAFLALWCFSPAFGTPMYYHMVDQLGFKQDFIGGLNALTAAGAAIGAWVFARHFVNKTITERANFSIIAAAVGILAYLAIAWPNPGADLMAGPLNAFFGFTAQIGSLTIFTIAARACPARAEGFVFAALMSVYNGVEQLSAVIGARLYDRVFDRALAPLLWVAAGSFLLCFLLVPRLRRFDAMSAAPEQREVADLHVDEVAHRDRSRSGAAP
jgi:MFS family permease